MPHRSIPFGTRSTVCGAILTAWAVLSAAPAGADPTDDAVLAGLSSQGITVTDRATALATAHGVCSELDRHQSSGVVAGKIMRDTNLSAKQAGYFVGVAIAAYCPEHKGETEPSVIWMLPPFPFQTTQ